jgi:hypothetical protein
MARPAGRLLEIPPSTVQWGKAVLPVAGGGYLRLYPYQWTAWSIRHLNEHEQMPAVVFQHPRVIDPHQPRQHGSALSRFRHYVNLDKTETRLRRLLAEFAFAPISDAVQAASVPVSPRLGRLRAAAPAPVGGAAW